MIFCVIDVSGDVDSAQLKKSAGRSESASTVAATATRGCKMFVEMHFDFRHIFHPVSGTS